MPPVSSRTTSRSVPSRISRLSGLASSSEANGLTGRRLAKSPSPSRIPSRPCSGRGLAGSVVSHCGPPTAPRRMASAARQPARVSSGSGEPVASIAAPPIRYSENVKPSSALSTSTVEATTSGPIPSPGRRAMWALMAAVSLSAPAPAAAQGLDQTCLLPLTKSEPATVNVAYPDDSAAYYSGAYQLVPGTRIRIHGRFPHARYMSFNVYDAAQRPIDGLADVAIKPDAGSINPFERGADRTSEKRDYTVFIDTGPRPEQRAPNTIYTGTGQNGPNTSGTFIYRVYIPDRGRDDTGGVGVPTVTVESTSGAGGGAGSPCSGIEKPKASGVNEAIAQQALPDRPATGASGPPRWRKFVNVLSAVGISATGSQQAGPADLDQIGGNGGFLSNLDNAYVSAFIDRANGKVVVTRFRAPTFPDTRPPATRMPGGQLRYWSLCQNDPSTQRFVACLNDDRAFITPDGFATYVISTPGQRPSNATRDCGVNWLPWGPSSRGVLIYRHMLPSTTFAESIQRAKPDHEAATMGDYFPSSQYLADKAAFEQRGCIGAAVPPPLIVTRGTSRRTCKSRRLVAVRVRRGVATVRAGSRVRRVRVRRGRVLVDLRGLRRGSYRVRVTMGGKVVRRTVLRTCTRKGAPRS